MSGYRRYEERVVLDERDALYGGTHRFVAVEVGPEPELSPQPEPPAPEPTSPLAPEPPESVAPLPRVQELPAPPRNGSRETWAAHAASLGLTVPDGLGRDEIRALVDDYVKEQ